MNPSRASTAASRAASAPDVPSGAGDMVPFSSRVAALMAIRILTGGAIILIAARAGRSPAPEAWLLAGTYLAGAGALSGLIVLIPHRQTALGGFGVLLLADGVMLQVAQHLLGPGLGLDLALATFLAAVCLLASFRTGIKLAIWQALLIVLDERAGRTGLIPAGTGAGPLRTFGELILMWLMVVVICLAAALNERELRRRRHDAEMLQRFAAMLHRDVVADKVLTRLRTFLIDEVDARRVLTCTRRGGELVLLQGKGLGPVVQQDRKLGRHGSLLLGAANRPGLPARLLRLDPRRDPWLDQLLPGARKLVVLPLMAGDGDPIWTVFEHGAGSGDRVERRVLATAGQAAATTALALSRAELYRRAEAFALTDGLTSVPNRRAFDGLLTELGDPDSGRVYALILADIDRFKSINDEHGHQVGDDVLRAIASALASAAPKGSMVARYGGEEFAVVIPGAGTETGMAAAERLRAAVEGLTQPFPVTASFGVASSTGPRIEPAAVIAAADQALYQAKQDGRNAVRLAAGTGSQGGPPVRAAAIRG